MLYCNTDSSGEWEGGVCGAGGSVSIAGDERGALGAVAGGKWLSDQSSTAVWGASRERLLL